MFEIIPTRRVVRLYPLADDTSEIIELSFHAYDVYLLIILERQRMANSGCPWSARWLTIRSLLIEQKLIPTLI